MIADPSHLPLPLVPTPRPKMACELFFTDDPDAFGVRYDDGSEDIVANTESNREVYKAQIEYYQERETALTPWRE